MRHIGPCVLLLVAAMTGAARAQEAAPQGCEPTANAPSDLGGARVPQPTADTPAVPGARKPTVRITSPLGRTGLTATIRIVAQVQPPPEVNPLTYSLRARFAVDGAPVGDLVLGPPWAVEWTDENPFEQREIAVDVEDSLGNVVRDTVVLPPFEIEDRTDVRSVLLEAGVYDSRGRPAPNLAGAAFAILEDGAPQTIDLVTRESVPTTVALLVDNSRSMRRRMAAVRHAAAKLARSLPASDRVIVVPFNHAIGTITGPTDDAATVAEAIDAMRADGGTAMLNGVVEAARLLDGLPGRRAIVLLTDGFDENSTIELEAAIQRSNGAHVTVYTVGVGGVHGVSLDGEGTLRRLADGTGGRVFFPWRDVDLVAVSADIAADAHSRYLLTYTPTNQRKDGTWRQVALQVPEGYVARTRTGYRAPAPPPIRPVIEFSVADSLHGAVEIGPDDVEVLEDGVAQSVEAFQEAVEPVSIVMALDASGSMVKSADTVREAARGFVSAIRPEDQLALITFADEPLFGHVLGTNRHYTTKAIDTYQPAGGTALYDALWNALMLLKPVSGRRAIVVLTDGKDENNPGTAPGSAHSFAEVLDLAQQVGATIFTVGLGAKVETPVLRRLAEISGGAAYLSPEPTGLADQFRLVVNNLRQRYVVSYTSTNSDHDGGWRKVEVRPRKANLVVASSGGYFAPEE